MGLGQPLEAHISLGHLLSRGKGVAVWETFEVAVGLPESGHQTPQGLGVRR